MDDEGDPRSCLRAGSGPFGQVRVHRFKHLRRQAGQLQQTTDIEDLGLIRNRIRTAGPGEQPHRGDLMQCYGWLLNMSRIVSRVAGKRPALPG